MFRRWWIKIGDFIVDDCYYRVCPEVSETNSGCVWHCCSYIFLHPSMGDDQRPYLVFRTQQPVGVQLFFLCVLLWNCLRIDGHVRQFMAICRDCRVLQTVSCIRIGSWYLCCWNTADVYRASGADFHLLFERIVCLFADALFALDVSNVSKYNVEQKKNIPPSYADDWCGGRCVHLASWGV